MVIVVVVIVVVVTGTTSRIATIPNDIRRLKVIYASGLNRMMVRWRWRLVLIWWLVRLLLLGLLIRRLFGYWWWCGAYWSNVVIHSDQWNTWQGRLSVVGIPAMDMDTER